MAARSATRNFDDLQRIWKLINGRRATLLAVRDSIDTTIANGVLILRNLIAIAEYESASISDRTRSAKAASARNGMPNPGGMRAFGYTPDKLQLVPHEADAIKEAAGRLLAGQSLVRHRQRLQRPRHPHPPREDLAARYPRRGARQPEDRGA